MSEPLRDGSITPIEVILSRDARLPISEAFPDGLDPSAIDSYAQAAMRGVVRSSEEYTEYLALLGYMLYRAKKDPRVYQGRGFKTLGEYELSLDPTSGKHGSMYAFKLFFEQQPRASLKDCTEIGHSYIVRTSRVAKLLPTQGQKDNVYQIAANAPSLKALEASLEVFTGEGFTQAASLTLVGDLAEISAIRELCRDLRSRVPGENRKDPNTGVILAALESFSAEPLPMTENGDGSYRLTEEESFTAEPFEESQI